jgi:hypothetical protein
MTVVLWVGSTWQANDEILVKIGSQQSKMG